MTKAQLQAERDRLRALLAEIAEKGRLMDTTDKSGNLQCAILIPYGLWKRAAEEVKACHVECK